MQKDLDKLLHRDALLHEPDIYFEGTMFFIRNYIYVKAGSERLKTKLDLDLLAKFGSTVAALGMFANHKNVVSYMFALAVAIAVDVTADVFSGW
jgi:hypothetical protein